MSIEYRNAATDEILCRSEKGNIPRAHERIWLLNGKGTSDCYDVEDVCWWVSEYETRPCIYLVPIRKDKETPNSGE